MKFLKLTFVLVLSICLLGCAFEENREVEMKLTKSVNDFHALFNQEKFEQIYSEADEELKNKFTEQQFVSYLEVVRKNDVGNLKEVTGVWLDDDLKDVVKRTFIKRTKFSHVQLAFTEKAMLRERFEWNLTSSEPKLAAYEIEKVCDKPCRLVINTK